MRRFIVLAKAVITSAIIADCGAMGFVAYRWSILSEAPTPKVWSGLVFLTAAVVVALIRVRDFSKE